MNIGDRRQTSLLITREFKQTTELLFFNTIIRKPMIF